MNEEYVFSTESVERIQLPSQQPDPDHMPLLTKFKDTPFLYSLKIKPAHPPLLALHDWVQAKHSRATRRPHFLPCACFKT